MHWHVILTLKLIDQVLDFLHLPPVCLCFSCQTLQGHAAILIFPHSFSLSAFRQRFLTSWTLEELLR